MAASPNTSSHQSKHRSHHSHKEKEEAKVTRVEYEVPDGGYGWVIVVCAFAFISMPMGVSASFALYYEEWIDVFDAGKVRTSLVGSVGSGCVPLLGSLGGMILTNLFNDIRLVGITGCIVAASGLILSYFVYDISLLAFTYGAIGGLGMGLMFNCAYLSVGYYFDKNRAFATALASSGTGFGTLISRLINMVIKAYGWRGSLFILAGICIQLLVLASLIRPLYAKKVANNDTMALIEEELPKITDDKHTTAKEKDDINAFSSHEGIGRRKLSIAPITHRNFSSHMHMSQVVKHNDKALRHHTGDIKLNPYNRDDLFFSGSSYDIAKIKGKSGESPQNFASQLTIDSW
ncbi:monocarboxylate transporter 9-like [Watersipora subatra]|uniref:monocarboxylate transporter 9-like n=1 Tax=Watersipora subatra TaxID=2589382 RepID=UPI00355B3B8B